MGAKINYGFLKTKRIMDKNHFKISAARLDVLKWFYIADVCF